jgi:hypothetical protein
LNYSSCRSFLAIDLHIGKASSGESATHDSPQSALVSAMMGLTLAGFSSSFMADLKPLAPHPGFSQVVVSARCN